MATITFYNPYRSAYRDENSDAVYNRFMDRFIHGNDCACAQGNVPAANISEIDKEFRIEIALPGVDKKNIRMKLENGYLQINVEQPEEKEEKEAYERQEFNYADSSRTFKISEKIDTENISAKYENGILMISLAKKEAYVKKPAQTIVID